MSLNFRNSFLFFRRIVLLKFLFLVLSFPFKSAMNKLLELTKNSLSQTDIEVLDVQLSASGLLRIVIDRLEGVTAADCEAVARQLIRIFQVESVSYKEFEVSSPGIDRPLLKETDFLRFLGHRIKIRLQNPIYARTEFQGIIQKIEPFSNDTENSFSNESTKLRFALHVKENDFEQIIRFSFHEIAYAKLDPMLDFKVKSR